MTENNEKIVSKTTKKENWKKEIARLKTANERWKNKIKDLTEGNNKLKIENKKKIADLKEEQVNKLRTPKNTSIDKKIENLTKEINKINKNFEIIKELKIKVSNLENEVFSEKNSNTYNLLHKNFIDYLYWNYLESNYKINESELLIKEKLDVSKCKFSLSLREFLTKYKTVSNMDDDRFIIMKKKIESDLKFGINNQLQLLSKLHNLAHSDNFEMIHKIDHSEEIIQKENDFIKELFTIENYKLFFPKFRNKLSYQKDYHQVLKSYYIDASDNIVLKEDIKYK